VTGFIIGGVVLALIGAALMSSALLPEDAMTAVPLPEGNARRALLPVGILLLMAGVVLPAVGVTTLPPPTPTPTPTFEDTPTPTDTATNTPPPTIAIVATATPRPPTLTPSQTFTPSPTLGTLAPQQSAREGSTPGAM
jgi:hypothetical protein